MKGAIFTHDAGSSTCFQLRFDDVFEIAMRFNTFLVGHSLELEFFLQPSFHLLLNQLSYCSRHTDFWQDRKFSVKLVPELCLRNSRTSIGPPAPVGCDVESKRPSTLRDRACLGGGVYTEKMIEMLELMFSRIHG